MEHYRPSIPKSARERIAERYPDTGQRKRAEYKLNGALVGIRQFHPSGELAFERPIRDGVLHGIVYRCDDPGRITSTERWSNGLPHGTARQYARDGRLVGTYSMKRGTGLDLWWDDLNSLKPVLSEVRYLQRGKWQGFEWWLRDDQKSVWEERHFAEDHLHGIERQWNAAGGLKRGFPRYWITGRQVPRREYIRASAKDLSLPRFRETDNRPQRRFPPEVKQHLAD